MHLKVYVSNIESVRCVARADLHVFDKAHGCSWGLKGDRVGPVDASRFGGFFFLELF